jgi:hypothetical protein
MNEKYRRQLFAKLAGVMLAGTLSCGVARADDWKALIIPASLNAGNVVELVSDEVQPITFALQAKAEVTARGGNLPLLLEWDLPEGMQIVSQGGLFELSNATTEQKNGRVLTSYNAQIPSRFIAGVPGSRLGGEGINHSLFIRVSQAVPVEQRVIRLNLKDGETVQNFEWPLSLHKLVPPAQYPKRTPLTLWDYNYSRATTPEAAQGVARLFKRSGITFTQVAADATYRSALEAQGVATGGYVHHSAFHSKEYPDYNASGKQLSGSLAYADPQSIIALPAGAEIPGVKQLLAAAKINGGYATFDYEPNGLEGFSPASVKVFKERYGVGDEEFEKFREYVAENGLETHLTQDEAISRNWRQWGEFRSEQTSNYMRRIYEAVKAQNPDVRVAVTPSRTAGKDSLGSFALGTDNSAMARYIDIIMPQLYSGYGGAQVKQVLQLTEAWHREIEQQKNGTRLWPLLLVRYSGATVFNAPDRLRQQIIGTLAYGSHGVGFYYPGNMDGTYWDMLARTTEDIAKYEDFYQDGVDVSEQFKLSGLPINEVKIAMFPSYQDTIKNPGWAFKAHRLNNRVLLTLINLEEANDLRFGLEIGKSKVLNTQNAEADGKDGWVVKAKQVGFVTLENE